MMRGLLCSVVLETLVGARNFFCHQVWKMIWHSCRVKVLAGGGLLLGSGELGRTVSGLWPAAGRVYEPAADELASETQRDLVKSRLKNGGLLSAELVDKIQALAEKGTDWTTCNSHVPEVLPSSPTCTQLWDTMKDISKKASVDANAVDAWKHVPTPPNDRRWKQTPELPTNVAEITRSVLEVLQADRGGASSAENFFGIPGAEATPQVWLENFFQPGLLAVQWFFHYKKSPSLVRSFVAQLVERFPKLEKSSNAKFWASPQESEAALEAFLSYVSPMAAMYEASMVYGGHGPLPEFLVTFCRMLMFGDEVFRHFLGGDRALPMDFSSVSSLFGDYFGQQAQSAAHNSASPSHLDKMETVDKAWVFALKKECFPYREARKREVRLRDEAAVLAAAQQGGAKKDPRPVLLGWPIPRPRKTKPSASAKSKGLLFADPPRKDVRDSSLPGQTANFFQPILSPRFLVSRGHFKDKMRAHIFENWPGSIFDAKKKPPPVVLFGLALAMREVSADAGVGETGQGPGWQEEATGELKMRYAKSEGVSFDEMEVQGEMVEAKVAVNMPKQNEIPRKLYDFSDLSNSYQSRRLAFNAASLVQQPDDEAVPLNFVPSLTANIGWVHLPYRDHDKNRPESASISWWSKQWRKVTPEKWQGGSSDGLNAFVLPLPADVTESLNGKTFNGKQLENAKLYVQEGAFVFLLYNNLLDWVNMDAWFGGEEQAWVENSPAVGRGRELNPCSGAWGRLYKAFEMFRLRTLSERPKEARYHQEGASTYLIDRYGRAGAGQKNAPLLGSRPPTVESSLGPDANSQLLTFLTETFLGRGDTDDQGLSSEENGGPGRARARCWRPGRGQKIVRSWQQQLAQSMQELGERASRDNRLHEEVSLEEIGQTTFSWRHPSPQGRKLPYRVPGWFWFSGFSEAEPLQKFDFFVSLRAGDDRNGGQPYFLLDIPRRFGLHRWKNLRLAN